MRWRKPNGMEIEINEQPANLEIAERLGWKPVPQIPESQILDPKPEPEKQTILPGAGKAYYKKKGKRK